MQILIIFAIGVGVFFFLLYFDVFGYIQGPTAHTPPPNKMQRFGPPNEHLICPHCQTKGMVRAKKVSRTAVSTGKVGGILKTNTKSQTTSAVTQHHCDQCGTTWDV